MGALTGKRILVAGGYGAVGRVLSADLVRRGADVTIGGRSRARADALARETGARGARIDVADASTWSALEAADLVVMCIDQHETRLVSHLLERGIDYIDLTAGDGFFRSIEALPPPRQSAVLLSVGLAPGLTNMLALAAADQLGAVPARVELGLLFGLADPHGDAGMDWTIAQLFDPAKPHEGGLSNFGPPWGWRMTYRMDFSDQHALARRWPGSAVATRLALESRLATAFLFGLAQRFAGNRLVEGIVRRSFTALPLGSDRLVVSAEARIDKRRAVFRFVGRSESRTTALLAGAMIDGFYEFAPRTGIWHSHDVFDAQFFLDTITALDIGRVERLA